MRKFILWNHDKTSSFDFDAEKAIISDLAGLGIGFAITRQNDRVTGYEKTFDDITLLVNFGANSNPYTVFNNFANFVANNGKNAFVLEYQVNQRTLFCDMWLKKMPKTQKKDFGVIAETLAFERLSYWYTIVNGTLVTSLTVNNLVMDLMPINLKVTGATTSLVITFGAAEIKISRDLVLGEILEINSADKKVILETSGELSNGYNLIDKSYETFLMAEKGTSTLAFTGTADQIDYNYKKWVID